MAEQGKVYLKFPENTRVEGLAKFAGVRPIMTDNYGEKWLFTLMDVDGTGEERGGTITQALAEKLSDVQIGDMVIIMKQDDGKKGVRWRVSVNSKEVLDNTTSALEHVQGNQGPNAARGSTRAPDTTLAEMGQLMTECMKMSRAELNFPGPATNEDSRSIGITLFIEANRKGIKANSIESKVVADPFGPRASADPPINDPFGDPGPTNDPFEGQPDPDTIADDNLPFS
jgi:hypothetical protein